MERHNSHSHNSIPEITSRRCLAQVTDACLLRGGLLEDRRTKRARYCRDCARVVRLDQSRLLKRQMRKRDWRDYRRYSFDQKGWRDSHRSYMRDWRRRRKEAAAKAAQSAHTACATARSAHAA